MDSRVIEIYRKFIKHKLYDKALDVLEASYGEDKRGTSPLIQKYRMGQTALARMGKPDAMKLLRRAYFLTARDYFDDFCIAMEWERPALQRFYLPRRKQLLPIVRQMQRLVDDEIDILCVSQPPGTGKTGLEQFFLDFCVGRNPLEGNIIASHNTSFLRGMYEESLRQLDPDGEYCWNEIFPERAVVKTNALDLKIDVDKAQRFSSFQFRSIQGGNAGLARAVGLLCVDDIIEGIEEALSEERLEAKWTKFSTDLLQRTQGNCKILMIATRWSVRDPIGRLQQMHEHNNRAVFFSVPALDKNDKSNFDYGGSIGFTTEYYHNLRETMRNDEASWRALYMNEPVERSGILYPPDELRRYIDLPGDAPDATWAVCDTKNKGDDYFCMPIALQYGDRFYIDRILIDNKTPEVVEPRLVDALLKYGVQIARFESNSAGGRIADNVQNKVKDKGGITKIVTKYSTANKETRIFVDSAFVKEHFLFRDISKYDAEYRAAMSFLVSYTMSGKNRHDDVPDAMSMLADFVQQRVKATAVIMKRPF